ncbi:EF-P beta-lysylation protein EpmB [Spongiibacter pelagi]|nr:EF-P beta-lysylation protein EpmB [Spongiibacter pelagi]
MIPANTTRWQADGQLNRPNWRAQDWQTQLSGMIRDPAVLFERLGLNPADQADFSQALEQFPFRVTEAFVAKMEAGNWRDPLLLQILPRGEEQLITPGYSNDPLGEAEANPVPGLIHKYHGRVLLIATSACAVHCRYCFRRSFPYSENAPSQTEWQQALDYIADRPDIHEVILSGGDPLALSNSYLEKLITRIADIPHIRTLRIHTRFPLVLPARIEKELISLFQRTRLNVVMVIHCNHANEIDEDTTQALSQLKHAGVALLNQSVILRGVNDTAVIQCQLSHTLFQAGVLPYYLHLLDRVNGAGHFEVREEQAMTLLNELRNLLPGYLVPKLVREIAGEQSKTPVTP